MTTEGELHPFFLEGTAGPLFALYQAPARAVTRQETFLFVPPFAEEMNRSRRVATLQAQALSAAGHGALILDLFGCGDSGGEFADATWEQWQADVFAAADWVARRHGGAVSLWGLRLGAALAASCAERQKGRFSRLLLWEPVVRGQAYLTQVLRIRVASGLFQETDRQETTEELRDRLQSGETLEIGGYAFGSKLAVAIDAVDMAAMQPECALPSCWIEVAGEGDRPLSAAAQRALQAWRAAGVAVVDRVVTAPRFWNLIETTIAPDLVAATIDAVTEPPT